MKNKQDLLLKEMTKLYLTQTTNYAVVDKETGQHIEQGFKWNNKEAEKLYSDMQEALEAEIKRAIEEHFVQAVYTGITSEIEVVDEL